MAASYSEVLVQYRYRVPVIDATRSCRDKGSRPVLFLHRFHHEGKCRREAIEGLRVQGIHRRNVRKQARHGLTLG